MKRLCTHPGCPRLDCQEHGGRRFHQRFARGGNLYGRRWGKVRAAYLAEHPWCVDCVAEGVKGLAEELDHIEPHRGDQALFWDESNWAGRCKRHHSQKTAREVGFGH